MPSPILVVLLSFSSTALSFCPISRIGVISTSLTLTFPINSAIAFCFSDISSRISTIFSTSFSCRPSIFFNLSSIEPITSSTRTLKTASEIDLIVSRFTTSTSPLNIASSFLSCSKSCTILTKRLFTTAAILSAITRSSKTLILSHSH